MYDYGARNYDPALGRWMSADQLAEEFVDYSPYIYASNDPVRHVDPDGNYSEDTIETDPPTKSKTATTQFKPVQKYQGGYVGESLDMLLTSGIQWIGSKISGSDVSKETSENIQMATSLAIVIVSKGKNGKADSEVVEQLSKLADDVPVVRGGSNTPSAFEGGSGVSSRVSDKSLDGISVNSNSGKSVKDLSKGIPHNKVGTTTVGDVRKAGGEVISSPTKNNPNHAKMSIPNAKNASELMKVIKNPAKR